MKTDSKYSGYHSSAIKESESIHIIKSKLDQRMFQLYVSKNDRTPNHDGFIELLEEHEIGMFKPIGTFVVQVKTISQLVLDANKYSTKTNFFNYLKSQVNVMPGFLVLVNIETKRVFCLYASKEKLNDERLYTNDSKYTTYLQDYYEITTSESFYSYLRKIYQRYLLLINNGSKKLVESKEYDENIYDLQQGIDLFNTSMDNELKTIKDLFFPDVWKFGISYSKTKEHSKYSLFPVFKGHSNDLIINEYDRHNNHLFKYEGYGVPKSAVSFVSGSIMYIYNKFVDDFYEHPKTLPNMVLMEHLTSVYKLLMNALPSNFHLSESLIPDRTVVNVKLLFTFLNQVDVVFDNQYSSLGYKNRIAKTISVFSHFVSEKLINQELPKIIQHDNSPVFTTYFDFIFQATKTLLSKGIKSFDLVWKYHNKHIMEDGSLMPIRRLPNDFYYYENNLFYLKNIGKVYEEYLEINNLKRFQFFCRNITMYYHHSSINTVLMIDVESRTFEYNFLNEMKSLSDFPIHGTTRRTFRLSYTDESTPLYDFIINLKRKLYFEHLPDSEQSFSGNQLLLVD